MSRSILILTCLLYVTSVWAANPYTSKGLKDVYFGESLYHAFQDDWFDAIARLDTELGQYRRLDEPSLDALNYHLDQAEFGVGDFELGYRMHLRAGRAISAVVDGNFEDPVRNEAIYRLARLYFQQDQPDDALHALERMRGTIPPIVQDDVEFLRGQILLAKERFPEAARVFRGLLKAKGQEGFAGYNLGIALIKGGQEQEGRQSLDRAGRLPGDTPAALAIRDKANLVLGYKLLDRNAGDLSKPVLERVRLVGPFSNRALLGAGWSDASRGRFERALVPWSILAEREVTDPAVQEALLAVPYAYGKLDSYGQAALRYGTALDSFGKEVDKLGASIASVKEGKFLEALAREELKQDADWVVKLRELPEAPETYYLLELMASHDFQESLKNYLDLKALAKKLAGWERDLDAFEDVIRQRKAYYQPLIPDIDRSFRQLDSQMRLRLEQRDRVRKRLQAMLVAPRPDHLASSEERIAAEKIALLEKTLSATGEKGEAAERIGRLRGALLWNISTEYDRRLTETFKDLHDLNEDVDRLQKQYDSFVRTRQAATLSFRGYDDEILRQRSRIASAREKVKVLTASQGKVLEAMAVDELTRRRERLEQFKITARFAIADSYDRATRAQNEKSAAKVRPEAAVKSGKESSGKPESAAKVKPDNTAKAQPGNATAAQSESVAKAQSDHAATAQSENAAKAKTDNAAGVGNDDATKVRINDAAKVRNDDATKVQEKSVAK